MSSGQDGIRETSQGTLWADCLLYGQEYFMGGLWARPRIKDVAQKVGQKIQKVTAASDFLSN
jgi:hypothetical protein